MYITIPEPLPTPEEPSSIERLYQVTDRVRNFLHPYRFIWGGLVGVWTLGILLLINFVLPKNSHPSLYMYLYQPMLWGSLAALSGLGLLYGLPERPLDQRSIAGKGLLLGGCQVALFIFVGLFAGFGQSPYSHRLGPLLGNLFYLTTMLIGVELSRAYLVALFSRRHTMLSLVLASLLFTLLSLPLGAFLRLDTIQETIQALGQNLLPTLSENLLASFLALLGGPLASIAYRGCLLAFEWISPILPNPGWFITALLGTLFPAYGLLFLYNQSAVEIEHDEPASNQGNTSMAWTIAAGFSVIVLGFTTGLFGVRPTLIASGSMSPYLQVGDVVVIREAPVETLKVGDVVSVRTEGLPIIHRVVEIEEAGGQTFFITRGDDNDSNDEPVLSQAVQGKVVFIFPKIGWVSIFIRQILSGVFR